MRKNILTIALILFVLSVSGCRNVTEKNVSQHSSDTGTASIIFKEYEHHFGKVTAGEKVGYTFTFENQGTGDLVLASALTTCGCTVPKFDRKPIPPGENGNLEVLFDTSGRSGMQTKTITINSNASKPVVILKISAEIINKN
jgi:hypothetical protein